MEPGTVPPKHRREWAELLTDDVERTFSNFVLQMKVHQACKEVKSGTVSLREAIESLHGICQKYSVAVHDDMKKIFKTW